MGKYVHKFITNSEYESFTNGESYIEPFVSYTVEKDEVDYNPKHECYIPLTFEILSDGNIEFKSKSYSGATWSLAYKKNNENWSEQLDTFTISVIRGDIVQFKGINERLNTDLNSAKGFSTTVSFNVYGNPMSLSYGEDLIGKTEALGSDFCKLFSGCSNLIDASRLILPITNVTNSCYNEMFMNCRNLIAAPELPATSVGVYSYGEMFSGCTSLATAPKLPATTLGDYCYYGMFNNCTSLTTTPELPATTLVGSCYVSMFSGCTGLTTVPELPATKLQMYCYEGMFRNCSSLNYIKAMFTTTPSTTYTKNWVSGVASTGTFVKNANAAWTTTGVNGVPEGWTVETASE